MNLMKRYFRSIQNNLSFYVSSTILTIATLVLFFIMNLAGDGIMSFGESFFASQKLEDADFTTYIPIPEEDIKELEKEFSLTLEPQFFGNIETGDTTVRVFKKTKETNLYQVTVGNDIKENDEVIISEGYAVENNVSTGDLIKIGEKEYTVTGLFQRPDYLYMLQNETDSYKNITTFFLAYVTDEEFETLGCDNCIYQVRYEKDNQEDFRKEINERYYMRSYLSAKDNMRIDMVPMQAEMFIVMSYMILAIMPLVVVVLVSVVISRKVKSEQKLIGTLTALGYTKGKLMLHYAGFAMIPGLLGGIFSVIVSTVFAQSFGELCLQDYEPMRIVCKMNPLAAVAGILIPTLMYMLAACIAVSRLLRKDTVLLLHGNADQNKKSYHRLLYKTNVSFRIKYALRSLLGNPSRTFVVLLGIFLGSYISLLGFSFLDTMEYTKQNMVDEMGSYDYQYVLNELITDNPYGGEVILMSPVEFKNGNSLSLIGTNDSNPYYDLKDENGTDILLEDSYYVTSVTAFLNNIEAGDKLILCNPLTLEEEEITVSGIIENDMLNAVFTSDTNARELLGLAENSGNVIMSDEALDIPDSALIQTIKKSDAKEQFQTMSSQMDLIIYALIGLGSVICIAAIYVAANMLIAENRPNISMLKVLGYKDGQIFGIVLNSNHILLPLGILLSIPLVFATTNFFMAFLADFIGVLPAAYIAPQSYIYTILLTCISYFGSLLLLSRKVSKVDMVESLKDNRE